MKTLIITAASREPITLPSAYCPLIQGLFYSAWKTTRPDFHDQGIGLNGRHSHPFTFAPIEGSYHIGQDKTITFDSPISIEFRTAVDALADEAASVFADEQEIMLGSNRLTILRLEKREEMIFPGMALVRMRSPVTLHETLPDRKTRFIAPDEPDWASRISANLNNKIQAIGMEGDTEFRIRPVWDSLRKRVINFKGIYITGYTGDFTIETDPKVMKLLYYCGLGSRNSQGFGMFDF